jgi:hypothetical protein
MHGLTLMIFRVNPCIRGKKKDLNIIAYNA